uniref:Regulator of G protein signalling-like domain-containing protein n=1 Tax=Cynoglossus semilaevis TaxID=244447 RepID=A0A3P8VV42_CYNSE
STHDDKHFGACSNPAMSIIGAEDEDFENELTDDQCSSFNHIEKLKERPTHLLVFLHHVILQFDPAPLLCYLHADLFKNLGAKETKKQFVEFHNTFIDKSAVNRTRPELIADDVQRLYAQEVQAQQAAEVAKQLEDFRQKRTMGMTPNEAELIDVESHYHTDLIVFDCPFSCSQSIFSAVVVYMKHLGVKSRAVDKKSRGGFFRRQLVKVTLKKNLKKNHYILCFIASATTSINCVSSTRLEPPVLCDGGDVSPVTPVGVLTIGEPISPIDLSTDEVVDR